MKVKEDYFKNLEEMYLNGLINKYFYEEAKNINNFKYWLNFLSDVVYDVELNGESSYNLSKIFKPLAINQYGNFVLFKYKNYIELNEMGYSSDFFELYNNLYLECRSIVIDIKNDCVALTAMKKFKNYGEDEKNWSQKNIQKLIENNRGVEITNKLDGSFQQYRFYREENKIIGSGSQALNPEESWRLKKGYELLLNSYDKFGNSLRYKDMLKDYPECTFMFEFVSPDNPIVVKYNKDEEGLYLISARNNYNGKEMDMETLQELAKKYNVKITEFYKNLSFNEILNSTKKYNSNEKEGWVVKIYDKNKNFLRVKVKIDDYVLMHKVLGKILSPKAIIEAYDLGKWDDFYGKIPELYKESAKEIYNNIEKYYKLKKSKIKEYYDIAIKELKEKEKANLMEFNNKNFAILINNIPKEFKGDVLNLFYSKPIFILKKRGQGYIKYKDILSFLEKYESIGD